MTTSFYELAYSQALDELKVISENANSLDMLIKQSIEIIKSKLDFVFVGIAFVDANNTFIRRYMGTEDLYVKRTMFISVNNENDPMAFVFRNGHSCLIHMTEEISKNPHFPDEKVEFYLPLKTDRGNFGVMEIFSTRDSDWKEAERFFPLLDNLVSQFASVCIIWVDNENIGFWINQE